MPIDHVLLLTGIFLLLLGARHFVRDRSAERERKVPLAPHAFSADRPIVEASQDRLGRGRFASAVADAIATWQGRDSLVLGLYGEWGSGKTSLLNLISNRLRGEHGAKVVVVTFNPWEWLEHRELSAAFFGELSAAVRGGSGTIQSAQIAETLTRYSDFLRVGSDALRGLRHVYTFLVVVLVVGLGLTLSGGVGRWIGYTLAAAGSVAALLTLISEGLGQFAQRQLSRVTPSPVTLSLLKHRLRNLLASSDRTYLILIDDIDRLPPPETLRVFQLVKANADFPNVVYLLPFDRAVVTAAIRESYGDAGSDFLDKIIQIRFDIPRPGRRQMEQLLFAEIDRVLASSGDAMTRFSDSQSTWHDFYRAGLIAYLDTPRDATRYVASLSFMFNLLTVDGALEVDPVDLIAVEVLRLFEPAFYEGIARSRDLLTTDRESGVLANAEVQGAQLDQLLSTVPEERRRRATEILLTLFPPARDIGTGGARHGHSAARWRALRRVCHGETFERYFRFDLPDGQVTRSELTQVTSQTDVDKIVTALRALRAEGRFESAVTSLRVSVEDIPDEGRVPIAVALCLIGDDLSTLTPGFFEVSEAQNAAFLALDLIESLPMPDRAAAMTRIVEETAARGTVYLPAYIVGLLDQKDGRAPGAGMPEGELEALGRLMAAKIHDAAASGQILSSRRLGELLYWWSNWDETAARQWVNDAAASTRGAVNIISALESRYRTTTDSRVEERRYFPFDQIESLIPVDALLTAAARERAAQTESCGAVDPVVERFVEAVDQHRAGTYRTPGHPF